MRDNHGMLLDGYLTTDLYVKLYVDSLYVKIDALN